MGGPSKSEQPTKTKGMCIATRCTSVEQFIQMFCRFVDEDSFFVATLNTRPPGLETSFSVQLADGTPVLRGICVVLQAWTNAANPFKTPGVRLGIKRLTANSMQVFEQLLITRSAGRAPQKPPPIPASALAAGTVEPRGFAESAKTNVAPARAELKAPKGPAPESREITIPDGRARPHRETDEPIIEQRTPGSDFILPANPLMNLTDESLEGYVDCTLYEETGNFFPVDGNGELEGSFEDVAPPPLLAPRAVVENLATPLEVEPPVVAASAASDLSIPVVSLVRASAPAIAAPEPQMLRPEPPVQRKSEPNVALPIPAPRKSEPSIDTGRRVDLAPRTKRGSGWLIFSMLVVLAAGAGAYVIAANPFDGTSAAAPAPKAQNAVGEPSQPAVPENAGSDPTVAVEVPAVGSAAAAPSDETPNDEPVDEAPSSGTPVVGDGPCKVTVNSTPAGSMVRLDGATVAPSPVIVATTCGKHKIDIAHPRYAQMSKLVTLVEDKPGSIDVRLSRPNHVVTIYSQPPGATVFIDGRRAGTTPTKLNVLGFTNVSVELKKTGFQPATTKLYSKLPDDNVTIRLTKW